MSKKPQWDLLVNYSALLNIDLLEVWTNLLFQFRYSSTSPLQMAQFELKSVTDTDFQ